MPALGACGVCRSDCVISGFLVEVVEVGAIVPEPTAQIPPVTTAAAAPFLVASAGRHSSRGEEQEQENGALQKFIAQAQPGFMSRFVV